MKPKIIALEQYAKISGGQRVLLSIIEGLGSDFAFRAVVPETGELTRELQRRNVAYDVFPVGYYGIGKKSFIDVCNYLVRVPVLVMRLARLLEKEKPALVWANGARSFVWGTLACAFARVPMIWHVHSIFPSGLERRLLLLFGRAKTVRRVIAVSEAAGAPLSALGDKLLVMRNAVDTETYFPQNCHSAVLRNRWSIRDKTLVGIVGLLIEWKGVDDFIRAAGLVHKRNPRTHFLVVGDVLSQKDAAYKASLLDLARQHGLNDAITFTGHRNDIPQIMRDLDIYALASKKPDPCPTSLLQAMGCAVAVVAPHAGGPAEIIENGITGLLYEPGNVNALAESILSLAENPEKRRNLACAAAATIYKKYRQDEYLTGIKTLVRQTIGSGDGYEKYNPTWHLQDSPWKTRKITEVITPEIIRGLKSPVLVVDIGCGAGGIIMLVADFFEEKGLRVVAEGFDVAPVPLEKARASCPAAQFRCGPFDKTLYNGTNQRATFALLIDILEHLENPDQLLNDAGDVSEFVICHLPLEDNLMVNLRCLKNKFRRTVGHVRFYNDRNARSLFARNGFIVINSIYTCLDYDADYRIKSPLRRILLQPLRKLLFRRFPRCTAGILGNVSLLVLLKKNHD